MDKSLKKRIGVVEKEKVAIDFKITTARKEIMNIVNEHEVIQSLMAEINILATEKSELKGKIAAWSELLVKKKKS